MNELATQDQPGAVTGGPGQLQVGDGAEERKLEGDERAAVIVLALGPKYGRPIFDLLDELEIRELSRAMSKVGPITQNMLDELMVEFVGRLSSGDSVTGNAEATERLLLSFLDPNRVTAIMEEIRGPAGRNIWEKLSNVQEDVLASYLKNEYPQTISVVLSKLSTDHASRILGILPEELAMDVIQRMLSLEPIQKDILAQIERTLRVEFMSNLSHTQRRDSHEQMADIFNNFDRQTEARFLTNLEDEDEEAAERIKSLMFTFDDLCALESTTIQTLLQNVEKNELALALKGTSDSNKEIILKNMSARAAKTMGDDMDMMGQVRLKDVDEAQSSLVNLAKDLAAKGDIVIAKSNGEEEMIG